MTPLLLGRIINCSIAEVDLWQPAILILAEGSLIHFYSFFTIGRNILE